MKLSKSESSRCKRDTKGCRWSSCLLNYNRINNSNQRLVSKSIVVHSIKNFISSSFSCYIHKQEIQFSSHARRSAFYEHGFFLLVISHIFIHLFALKRMHICAMFQTFPHLKNSLKRILKNGLSRWLLIRVFNKTFKSVLLGRRIAASGHCR